MAAERDHDLPPVQPARRTAMVRGLRPRLWTKRVLLAPTAPRSEAPAVPAPEPSPALPTPENPLTYDDQAHLHGGPGSRPRLDLED